MLPDLTLAIVCLMCAGFAYSRSGLSPVVASAVFWALIFGLRLVEPIGLWPISLEAFIVLGMGLLLTLLPAAWVSRSTSLQRPVDSGSRMGHSYLIVGTAVLAALGIIGLHAYRSAISAAAGRSFSSLSQVEVRGLENGVARGGLSPLVALMPLLTVVVCLAIFGAVRYTKIWWAVVVGTGYILAGSTSRTALLSALVQGVVFYLYVRRLRGGARMTRRGVTISVVALASSLLAFNAIGTALGKTQSAIASLPGYTWPEWTLSPLLYLVGGASALSFALSTNFTPYVGVTSIYVVIRLGSLLGFHVQAGNTIAQYVPIPVDYNVYTGYGQMYFDFGLLGVVVLSLTLGIYCAATHARALRNSIPAAFTSSVLASVLFSMPLGFRLFNLDVATEVVFGYLVLRAVTRFKGQRITRTPKGGSRVRTQRLAPSEPGDRL